MLLTQNILWLSELDSGLISPKCTLVKFLPRHFFHVSYGLDSTYAFSPDLKEAFRYQTCDCKYCTVENVLRASEVSGPLEIGC